MRHIRLYTLGWAGLLVLGLPARAESPPPFAEVFPVTIEYGTAQPGVVTALFGGVTPPHGYMVCVDQFNTTTLWISDDPAHPPTGHFGPGQFAASGGFIGDFTGPTIIGRSCFSTPAGYKPPGPVLVGPDTQAQFVTVQYSARAW